MTFSGFRPRPKSPCIICGEEEGTIHTRDGPVCASCMPHELLDRAGTLSRDRIILYCRVHPGWTPCCNDTKGPDGPTVSEDRSMAITLGDPVVLADELNREISSAEGIDLIVSFIKMSGLNLLIDSLRAFTGHGRLRVITTAYMGATEYECLNELFRLPNTEVRMELDAERSRLHAKSFIFHREGGSTAYVGSANISKTALTSGEEWVVKIREADLPLVIDDLDRGFETVWRSGNVRPVDAGDRTEIESALEKRGVVR